MDNAITTRTGYDFSGWYLSGVLYTSGSTMPAEDITLTAVWDINEYEVDASVAT
ncbi:InlB B-repeat-containing protein [bacterium]|nr:InlB B-repeat-containing protein [bacterium]